MFTLDNNNGIIPVSGTSIAAPFVTSQVILLRAQCPSLKPTEIHDHIQNTSIEILTRWKIRDINYFF